jgi:hypothetical protein
MLRFYRNFAILAGLAIVATLVTGSIARADIIVTFQEDSGLVTTQTVALGSPLTPGGTFFNPGGPAQVFGDFSIAGVSLTEAQTSPKSEILSATVSVTNNGLASHTLTATVQATGFTLPTAPPGILVSEHIGGTAPTTPGGGAGNLLSFSSQVDTQSPASTLSPDITTGLGFAQDGTQTIATGVPSVPPFYSILQSFSITLNPGANLQVTGRTDLTAVPEPASVAMALTGLPIIGLLWALRRRRA